MQQHSNDLFKEIDDFFGSPPTVNQKAWGVINEFYHLILTYMEEHNISRADLARRLGKSRSAITQMFNKTPNMTIKRMVEIAEAIGIEIHIASSQIHQEEWKEDRKQMETQYIYIPYHADMWLDTQMPSSTKENRYVNFQKGDVLLKASQYSHEAFVH
jgi:transcriptional regulator with XRE-family HTH domain